MKLTSKITIAILITAIAIAAQAATITFNQARNTAIQFMKSRGMSYTNPQSTINASSQPAAKPLYIFNAINGGYVVIAGDDRAPVVLAYSDNGTLNSENMPTALKELLDGYAAQIEVLDTEEPVRLTPRNAITPLLRSHWNQGSPYNILLPFVSGNRAKTGCVATAMAQIMYCYQWPEKPTTTIPAYTTSTNSIFMPSLSPVNFDWDAMHDTYYTNDTTTASANAVATLMKYCDQALNMDFLASSSSASTALIPYALTTYFGYKASAHYVNRLNYSTADWEQMLYDELVAGRPVAYAGNKKSGGHSFVCDGCDNEGRFHINWGWGSQSDGYFVLSVLNPSAQGIGSASGAYGYIYNQAMAIGLEPGTSDAGTIAMTSTRLTINDMITTRSSYSGSFQVTVSNRFCNYTSQVASFDFGWGFYNSSGTMVTKLYNSYTTNLKPSMFISTNSRTLSFGGGITSGTYRIVPIYSIRNANDWHPCIGADESYIEVTINANKCTITGHGTAATKQYTVNDINFEGHCHTNRDMRATVNLTNTGQSRYDLVYLYIDGEFASTAFADIEPNETGEILYRFVPTKAGTTTLKWSLNDDGSNPFATRTLTISDMGIAQISATAQILNVIDTESHIIGSRQFSLLAHVTNDGETTYDEDITVRLFRVTHDNYGSSIHTVTLPVTLEAHADTTMRFDFDDLVDGLKHFAKVYFYSEGEMTSAYTTGIYTIQFPTEQEYKPGDVNGDGAVDIDDVNIVINIILGADSADLYDGRAELTGDHTVDIDDVNAIINAILNNG